MIARALSVGAGVLVVFAGCGGGSGPRAGTDTDLAVSGLRAATEADLASLHLPDEEIPTSLERVSENTGVSTSEVVLRTSAGSSCVEIETLLMDDETAAKARLDSVLSSVESYGELATPAGLPGNSLVVHYFETGELNCLSNTEAEEYSAVLYRSNVVSVITASFAEDEDLEVIVDLANALAQHYAQVLKD